MLNYQRVLGMSSSQLTFIFFRRVETTNQNAAGNRENWVEFCHGSMIDFAEYEQCDRKKPCWLMIVWDCTCQHMADWNDPIEVYL